MNRKVITLRKKNIYIRWIYGRNRLAKKIFWKSIMSPNLTEWQTTLNAFSNLFAYSSVAFFLVVFTLFLLSLLPSFFYCIIPHLSFQSHLSLCLSVSLYTWAQPLKKNLLNRNFSIHTFSQLCFWIIMDGCHHYSVVVSFSGFVFNGFVNAIIFLPLLLHLTMLL